MDLLQNNYWACYPHWNSHSANLGVCMCQMAALLSTLDDASTGEDY